ncbi:MAG: toprim domain-containing protein [Prevotella sp.]|jgi:twinkle protein|nr:toprim domain-containing protein [Prevotella sp.]
MDNWSDLGIQVPFGRTSGKVKTVCPECQKGARRHKNDKSLSVNLDEGLYKCHYCGWAGSVGEKRDLYNFAMEKKVYKKPKWSNKTELSDKLVKYFEGRCISQATLKAMRVSEGMEKMPQKENKPCNTVQFNYFLNGELINIKYRTGDKCFKLVSGAELILWNIDSMAGQKEVIITEGEIDALSFAECGYKSVVSVPNGANSTHYLDDYIELFDDKETVYIASDTDREGIILRDELVRRLGPEKCRIVTYGEGCKDANEHLVKYGRQSLKNCIENAEEIRMEGVFSLPDIRQQVDMLFRKGLTRGYTTGHDHFDRLISFETGRLCVITGIPGHGKSEFLDEITVRLNLRYGLKFGIFSPENHPLAYHAAKLVSKFTGKRFDESLLRASDYEQACVHIGNNFFYICPEDDFLVDTIIEKAAYLVRKRGIKGLVIDPYNTIEHQIPKGASETNYISALLNNLVAFARKLDVLVFLVAHPRKMEIKNGAPVIPNLYDVNGSANFYNKADFGLTVYRDRTTNIVQVVVHKVKFKHLGSTGTSNFSYDMDTGRYTPNWGQSNVVFDHRNYLDDIYKKQQPALDFTQGKSPEDMEAEFIADVTSEGDMPF